MSGLTELSKSFCFVRVTGSGRVSNFPGAVLSAHMVAGSGGAATAQLRDGHRSGADVVVDLSAAASHVDARTFVPPLWFDEGVYVTLGENVESLFVTMDTDRRSVAPERARSWFERIGSWFR